MLLRFLVLCGLLLVHAVSLAQLLDISSVAPDFVASNPRVQPGNYGGELRMSPNNFTPLKTLNVIADPAGAATFVGLIYPRFMTFDPSSNEPFCHVCSSYSISQDATEVTFELREGMTWSDGRPITSHDVVATSHIFGDRDIFSNFRQFFDDGDSSLSFEAIDDDTVRMTLSRPLKESSWKQRMRWPVLPAHIFGTAYYSGGVEGVESLYPLGTTEIVSAGPWRFHSYGDDDVTLILEQNRADNWVTDAFGNKLPYADRLVFSPPESSDAEALAAGASDLAGSVPTKEVMERLQAAGKIVKPVGGAVQTIANFVVPNFTHPDPDLGELMRNREFRVALSMLVDRNAYQREEFGDLAEVAYNYNLLPGYRDLPYPRYSHDPGAARELLEGLGLRRDLSRTSCPDGCYVQADGRPLELKLSHFDRPDLNPYVPKLAAMLRQEGLEVVDDPLERQDYIDRVHLRGAATFRDFDLLFVIAGSSWVGQEFLQPHFDLRADLRYWGVGQESGVPPLHVQPWEARLSEIASLILSDLPLAERTALVAEGTVLFAEQLPMIPLVQVKVFQAYDPRLGNTFDQVMDNYNYLFLNDLFPLIFIR
jgi:peptide/nickel transport system substrate-binding protein